MLGKTWAVLGTVGVAFGLSACDEAPPAPEPQGPSTVTDVTKPFEERFDVDGNFVPDPRVLPAWRLGKTFQAQKGDQYDDQRASAPQHFAITEPPAKATFRPMVEWEPMQALVMSYPGYMLSSTNATQTVVQIAKIGSGYGEVWIMVDGNQAETGLKTRLVSAGMSDADFGTKVKFLRAELDSIWFIDSGPLPLVDEAGDSYAFADFRYYHERPLDDGLPTWLARNLESFGRPSPVTTYRMPLTTEGGTFQATTDGVCITGSRQIWNLTCYAGNCQDSVLSSSLEDLQDHPQTVAMEATLKTYAGCKDLVITHSITDDGTGHIDMYLKILDDDRVLVGEYDSNSSNAYERENATLMDENEAFLEAYVKPDGGGFQVFRLPMPGHRSSSGFGSVPFTYINSTFFNGVNLWPATAYANWESSRAAAQAVWDEVLPDHDNIWIDSTELSFYSGAIHCITRTIPARDEVAWVGDGTCASGTCAAPEHGYDDACQPEGADEEVCWGPAWLCSCNDCDSGCTGGTPSDCQGVPYEGCCEGGDVIYCDGGQLYRASCGNQGCGWNGWGGYYDCGQSGADPSGEFPLVCGVCEPQCDGKVCGDDGCGGSCGSCDGDAACIDGACRTDCVDCSDGEIGCDGTVAWLCMAGTGGCNTRQSFDCAGRGQVCEAGDCVETTVEPNPEPSPETAPEPGPEPTPEEAAEGTTTTAPDATSATTSDTDASTATGTSGGDTSKTSVGKRDEGCGAGGADGALGLGGALAALGAIALGRRRRVALR